MRVAYVCADPGVPVFGSKGCSIHVQEMLHAFLARGGDVRLFAARLGGRVPAGLRGVRVVELPRPSGTGHSARELALVEANRLLERRLNGEGPFDLIYERYSLWSFAAMGVARDTNVPSILEVNAPLIDEQQRHRQLVHVEIANAVARDVFRDASSLIAVSQDVANYLNRFPEATGRVTIVPNGVDPLRFSPDIAPRHRAEGFTIGFVGSLKRWHGVDRLLAAFQAFKVERPASRLLIIGDGPEREPLSQQLTECSPAVQESVCFTGAVLPEDIPGWLTSLDAAVAPYPLLNGFYFSPLKVFEYMAAGRAVIASRIGQLEDLIVHGENGMLSTPGDPDELVGILRKLHDDPAQRQRLGRRARETVIRQHTWGHVLQRILSTVAAPFSPTVPVMRVDLTS